MSLKTYLDLFRVKQWYKNLVVFLAFFFSGNLFNLQYLYLIITLFFALSFVSSAGYIANDLRDRNRDKLHPEKKNRPIASGKIGTFTAIIFSFILLIVGLSLAWSISTDILLLASGLFLLTQIYTFALKDILFADILTIAILFVLRALAGAVAIGVWVSPWLILCPFFLSLFLSVGKRHSEVCLLKHKAEATRKVLAGYTLEVTLSLMTISTTLLTISYALYSFLSEHQQLLYTLPFALYVIFRFYYLITLGSFIARSPERVVYDRSMFIGILLWLLSVLLVIYG